MQSQSTATEKGTKTKTRNAATGNAGSKTGDPKDRNKTRSGGSSSSQKKQQDKQGGRKPSRGPGKNKERESHRSEFEQKVIDIRRVTRVVAGGRRFGFRVTVVVGDMKGRVGVGVDKGGDTAVAIEKAVNKAKKNMIKAKLTDDMSIPYEVQVKYGATELLMRPSPGRGIVAGSAVRSILQMAGATDVVAKLLSRSGNKLNNARATVQALQSFNAQKK